MEQISQSATQLGNCKSNHWHAYTGDDPVAILYTDAAGVPMLVDLDNHRELAPFVVISGPEQNIWFSPSTVNI